MDSKPPPTPPPPPPPPPSPSPSPSPLRRLINLDTALSLHLHNLTQPIVPRSLLKTLEISGDGRLIFPILLSLILSPLFNTFLFDLLVGSILDLLFVGLIKHLVRRPRPVYNMHMSLTFSVDHWSFPSGHSSRVCFVASFVYLSSAVVETILVELRSSGVEYVETLVDLFGSDEVRAVDYVVSIVCLWAVLTSISRILLGRHFVFDVVAGGCLGVAEALVVFRYVNYETLSSVLS
ncbi:hypothetical protein LguiA_015502 [Lonicera macranthoides]